MRQFCFVLGLAALVLPGLGWSASTSSAPLPGAKLPDGERAIAMAWSDAHTLSLVVEAGEGYAVRDLDVRSGEFAVVNVPPSFKRLRSGERAPRFILAEDGSGLVALQSPGAALQPGTMSVFRRRAGQLEGVEQRGLPANFWVNDAAWGRNGELFLTARPYVNPEQPYSVGRLDTVTGEFHGVVLKGNVDLVSEILPLPERLLLLLKSWGYRGEYPQEPVISSWSLESASGSMLHSQARELQLAGLDSRQALALPRSELGGDSERWILPTDSTDLRRLDQGLASKGKQARITRDGQWLVLLVRGAELTDELEASETYVAMQALHQKKLLATAVACEQFAVGPDSLLVAALAKGGQMVYYYNLPELGPPAAAGSTQSAGATESLSRSAGSAEQSRSQSQARDAG